MYLFIYLFPNAITDFCGGCRMENSRQLEAAEALWQTVEDLFPKEKLALAALEYITAVAARHKVHKDPETPPGTIF